MPTLRRRYTALATGLIVGFLWGTWHVLIAVLASRGLAGEASLTGFVAGFLAFYFVALPAYRVLMVWLYDHTASLLLAMLMHAVLSASTIILQPLSAHGQFTWNVLLGAALWAVVAGLSAFLAMLANVAAGFSSLTLFTFVATFIQAGYVVVLYLFGSAGGLLALAWFAMTGRRFLTLEA